MEQQYTPFSKIYDSFLSKITDDMYMELTEQDTYNMLEELLISAIPQFEFPRIDLTNYEQSSIINEGIYCGADSDYIEVKYYEYSEGKFLTSLTEEEINILSTYMIVEWIGYQLASIELVRLKYSGSDFKFTSQANHISKLLSLQKDYERKGFHLQRLYKRREKDKNGVYRSSFYSIVKPYDED